MDAYFTITAFFVFFPASSYWDLFHFYFIVNIFAFHSTQCRQNARSSSTSSSMHPIALNASKCLPSIGARTEQMHRKQFIITSCCIVLDITCKHISTLRLTRTRYDWIPLLIPFQPSCTGHPVAYSTVRSVMQEKGGWTVAFITLPTCQHIPLRVDDCPVCIGVEKRFPVALTGSYYARLNEACAIRALCVWFEVSKWTTTVHFFTVLELLKSGICLVWE